MESEGRSPLRIFRHALRISDVFTGNLIFREETVLILLTALIRRRARETNGYRKRCVRSGVPNRIEPRNGKPSVRLDRRGRRIRRLPRQDHQIARKDRLVIVREGEESHGKMGGLTGRRQRVRKTLQGST